MPSSSWQHTYLTEVVALQRGHDLPAQDRVPGPIPIIGSFGVTGSHNVARYPGPGVMIGRSGSIGNATFSAGPYWPLNTSLFVSDFRGNDPRWVYWLLHSIDFTAYNSGSVQPSLNRNYLTKVPAGLPPLDEQRRIAEVLDALDDLIDTNQRSIDKLAETFDAHSWATAFSTAEVIELGSKVSLQKGLSYKGAFLADAGIPLISLASFSRAGSIVEQGAKYYTGPVPPRKLLREGDLVVANTDLTQERLLLGRPTIVTHESASSTHHTFQVAVEDSVDRLWVYSLLRHEPRREHLASFATGTTVTALPADALTGLEVPWPDRDRLESWHHVAAPLLGAARVLEIENSELRRTRDELLPLLMSGAVRVRPEEVAA